MTDLERMPPQAVELEQSVLGAMMLDPRAIDAVRSTLSPNCFYHAPHVAIYEALCSLHDQGEPVDLLSLGQHLGRLGRMDVCGGAVYLAKLASEVATAANAEHHARIVAQKAMLRTLIEKAHALSESAYTQGDPAEELIGGAIGHLSDMLTEQADGGLVSFEEAMSVAMEMIQKAHAAGGGLTGLDTSLPSLNSATGGWQPGDFIILAARPSVGKTALALQMAKRASEGKARVAMFSLEMSAPQLAQRAMAQETGVDLRKLRTGRLDDADWVNLTRNVGKLAQQPIYIDDRPSATVTQIRTECRRMQAVGGLDMVVIDYIQLMGSDIKTPSREQEVSSMSRGIKEIAREFHVPAIGLSQLSRSLESRQDKRPRLSDLRESGSLEQDADVVCFLFKPSNYDIKVIEDGSAKLDTENLVELNTAKQRNGPTGAFWMTWDAMATRFTEMAPEWRVEDTPAFADHPNN